MTIIIDLLRHGDVADGTKLLGYCDEPLSKLGWQQLHAVVDEIVDKKTPPWSNIITSPLQRCHAFAEALVEKFHLPLSVEPRFQEIGFGQWDGRLLAELYQGEAANRMMRFWQNPSSNPAPEGEAYQVFEQRVVTAWEQLLTRHNDHRDTHYLLVTHGGVIRAILRHVLHFPVENFFRIDVPYASLSRIKLVVPESPQLMFLNG